MVLGNIQEKQFISEFTPRFRDTDRVGHVNNAVFVTYIEIARVDWWTTVREKHNGNPINFIIARVEVDYKAPIHLGDKLSIAMWVSKIGTKSWEFSYKIFNQKTNVVHAKAKSIQVGYDYNTDNSVVLNEDVKQYLNELFDDVS